MKVNIKVIFTQNGIDIGEILDGKLLSGQSWGCISLDVQVHMGDCKSLLPYSSEDCKMIFDFWNECDYCQHGF